MMECLRCSACCQVFGIVEIREEDVIPEELTIDTEFGYRRMKTDGFTCCCLNGTECSIYNDRPSVCKIFQPGSLVCQMARQQYKQMKKE